MAISISAGPTDNRVNSTTACSVTVTGCTQGNTLILFGRWSSDTLTVSSITCSGETVATVGSSISYGSGTVKLQFFSIENLASSGSKTVTLTLSGTANQIGLCGIEASIASGGGRVSFDAEGSATIGGSQPLTSTITTGAANAAIFAMTSCSSSPDANVGSGYTQVTGFGNVWVDGDAEYMLDAGAAGVKTVDWGLSVGSGVIKSVSYKEVTSSLVPRVERGRALCRGLGRGIT